ncbi:MAG: hypothetical protein FWH27_12415 [Planctomycetaceae bacterium]|nr:hypothetical protein [Planctomycetaceae bacterium]
MDRIDSYIQQTFAKFRDVPEIQAQKEEMADHLRDRIADAIGQGKSEKEAFASATAAISDAMPDLEQTLAGFLRPEFQRDGKPKPNTKEIYINFYRYHRAMMLMFAMALLTLLMILISEPLTHQKQWDWCRLVGGATAWFNLFLGIHVVYCITAYLLKPNHIRRVSVSPWKLMAKYGIGVFLMITIWLVFCYTEVSPNDIDRVFRFLLFFLLFYSVFFVAFSCLGWFRQHRYVKAPDITQDTPLAKWGVLLTAVFLAINLIASQMMLFQIVGFIRQEYEYGGPYNSVVMRINELLDNEKQLQQQLRDKQDELNAVRMEQSYWPRNAEIVGETMERSPMFSMNPPEVFINRQNGSMLKEGTAAQVFDPVTYRPLWSVPGIKGDYKIIDMGIRFIPVPEGPGGSSDVMMGSMMPSDGMMMGGMGAMGSMGMTPSGGMMMDGMSAMGGGSGVGPPPDLPERKEHQLALDSDFPATDLAENVICARQFPFEEYKLGMIQAAAPETVEPGETFPVRIGVGNLDAKNAKLLLTVGYDDGLQQEAIPTGSTLFLGFVGAREYREYKTDFTAVPDANGNHNNDHNGEHTLRLTLRNESGQVIAETEVVIKISPQPQ